MAKNENYHEQQKIEDLMRLREHLKGLPKFVEEYFRGANRISSARTKLSYAHDLKIFFAYLGQNHACFSDKKMCEIELSDLEKISVSDIDMFLDYVSYYENFENNKEYLNNANAKCRKLSAIRSMFSYFYKKEKLAKNPASLVIAPKLHDKNIIKLEVNEVARLLDQVESGELLTERQKKYHEYTKVRDLALISVLLGTGIRVSECVGININDIDFDVNGIRVMRKGGNESIVYFNDEVRDSLLEYYEERKKKKAIDNQAFFLSIQNRRINVRSVQLLVKKYSALITSLKRISPHKLRSTYATNLYQESGDIYLVADALGHKDVNTTTRHYAKMDDERRRRASKYIKLRT